MARNDRSIIHEDIHGEEEEGGEKQSETVKDSSCTENCFHLEAIMNASVLGMIHSLKNAVPSDPEMGLTTDDRRAVPGRPIS